MAVSFSYIILFLYIFLYHFKALSTLLDTQSNTYTKNVFLVFGDSRLILTWIYLVGYTGRLSVAKI